MEFLNDMALFVEVVKAKSFRRAAEAIGVPNSTLSRRINTLEKAIGLRLLHRTTRKIELTEAGQLYFERSRRIVDEARLAHEQIGEMLVQPVGVLHASLPVDFANIFLAPLLVEFARRYPRHPLRIRPDAAPRRSGDRAGRCGDPNGRAAELESDCARACPFAAVSLCIAALYRTLWRARRAGRSHATRVRASEPGGGQRVNPSQGKGSR